MVCLDAFGAPGWTKILGVLVSVLKLVNCSCILALHVKGIAGAHFSRHTDSSGEGDPLQEHRRSLIQLGLDVQFNFKWFPSTCDPLFLSCAMQFMQKQRPSPRCKHAPPGTVNWHSFYIYKRESDKSPSNILLWDSNNQFRQRQRANCWEIGWKSQSFGR